MRRLRPLTGKRRDSIHSLLSSAAVSNAISILPLPLQQTVIDDRSLLTVPWTQTFQGIEEAIEAPTYLEGLHTDRLDPDSDPAGFRLGAFFWEKDRTVLYQSRIVALIDPAHPTDPPVPTPCWVYVSGTMSAALASRPTDLHKPSWTYHGDDTGFRFHATDTGQDYQWNGTAWVDVSLYHWATYGTHAQRLSVSTATLGDGTLWCETDRRNAMYQLQGGVWHYIAGTMYGTMSPDQRPTDLGVNDGGFEFRSTDLPARQFLWSQTAWVEVTPPTGDVQIATGTTTVTLTTVAQDVGVSLTLNRAGRYYLHAVFDLRGQGAGDAGQILIGQLVAGGSILPKLGFLNTGTGALNQNNVSQQWVYTAATSGVLVKLQAFKLGGSGSSTAQSEATLTALWVSA